VKVSPGETSIYTFPVIFFITIVPICPTPRVVVIASWAIGNLQELTPDLHGGAGRTVSHGKSRAEI